VVQHELGDARPLPARSHGQERNVRLVVANVGHEESTTDNQLFVKCDHAEVGVAQHLRHVDAGPEHFLQQAVDGGDVLGTDVAEVYAGSVRNFAGHGVLEFAHELGMGRLEVRQRGV
jgi:hypothetical protein